MKKLLSLLLVLAMLLGLSAAALAESDGLVDFLPDEKPALEDDFYAYVNFDLLQDAEIPDGYSDWSPLNEISLQIDEELSRIVDECVQNAGTYEKDTPEQKIADLYLCFVDQESRNAAGLGPAQPYIDRIQSAGTIPEYLEALAALAREVGCASLFAPDVDIDLYDSNMYALYLYPANTGLSKAFLEDESMSSYWDIYKGFLTDVLTLYGAGDAAEKADAIFALQRQIAAASLSEAEMRDYSKSFQPMAAADIDAMIPDFCEIMIGDRFGSAEIDQLTVLDPGQLAAIAELLTEENLPLLKDYSTAVFLCDLSYNLTMDFREAYINYNTSLQDITPRSLEEVSKLALQDYLGWDLGRIYVEKNFPEESKRDVEEMVGEIIEWYRSRIEELDWMSDETKAAARRKLDTMTIKIGYPDDYGFIDYLDAIQYVSPADGGSLIENVFAAWQAAQAYSDSLLANPADKSAWAMPPQTVNAYYYPVNNEIAFPAAIIRGAFYNPERSRAANLGGIGMVIGHEITHAFDSSGAMFDESGNLNMWWTEEDLASFEALQREIIDYYSAYEILPGFFIDGALTLGENIADLGALHCVTSLCGDDPEALRELFDSYAASLAIKETYNAFESNLLNDVHSPDAARVNAVLSSTDAFYTAYDIEEGDGMYVAPEGRVGIW